MHRYHAVQLSEELWHEGLTVAALMRFSWQVSNVCSVKRRPFCSRVSEPGVSAVLILLICMTMSICGNDTDSVDDNKMVCCVI